MARRPASRKYQLTINNPAQHGYTHDSIKSIISGFSGLKYWCLCDEVGKEGTPHIHVYIVFNNAVMFTTLHNRFYGSHIEPAMGSNQENRDYIRKEGKWLTDEKNETNLIETFEESGELPPDKDATVKESTVIYEMIKDGANDYEIMEAIPNAMNRLDKIDKARHTIREQKYKYEFRKLSVVYIWGETGVGKTRSVIDKHSYENIYRATNYKNPFDTYQGQDVIIFEEFRSSLPISEMLNYLDGHPVVLASRYFDRQACYSQVYIITNIPIVKQYPNIQIDEPATWRAFKRRINEVIHMPPDFDEPLDGFSELPD